MAVTFEITIGHGEAARTRAVTIDPDDLPLGFNEDFEQALFQLRAIIECQRLELRQQQQAQQNLLQQLLAE